MVLLGVVLILFPFVRKVKIGNFLELERNITETRKDIEDFRGEVRNTFSVISTNIASARASADVYNYFGDSRERRDALQSEKSIEDKYKNAVKNSEELKEFYTKIDEDDYIISLARTRISIERFLRFIMGKRLKGKNFENIRFMNLNRLVRDFIRKYPKYEELGPLFHYVIKICNAAIHAQPVPKEQAKEAIELGTKLISVLKTEVKEKEKKDKVWFSY